jgi:hypothetical protein
VIELLLLALSAGGDLAMIAAAVFVINHEARLIGHGERLGKIEKKLFMWGD